MPFWRLPKSASRPFGSSFVDTTLPASSWTSSCVQDGAAVRGDLDEAVVPQLLDRVVVPRPEADVRARRHVDRAGQALVAVVLVVVGPPGVLAAVRRAEREHLVGEVHAHGLLGAPGRRAGLPEGDRGAGAAVVHDLRVQPAEDVLAPGAHVRGQDAVEPAGARAAAHDVPEARVRVARPDRVVEVGQAEVVAELVRDDAGLGALRLVGDVRHLVARAAERVAAGALVDDVGVRPQGVRPLLAAAVGLVDARVDDDDVVEHAVGLEQVAVPVDVLLVLDVERRPVEVRLRPGQLLERVDGDLVVAARVVRVPLVALEPGLAGVGRVPRLRVRHLDPVGHVAGQVVPALGDLLVVVVHRQALQAHAAVEVTGAPSR